MSNERPFQPIKFFFQINLKDHVGLMAFHPFEVIQVFLNNDGIIISSPLLEEPFFIMTNYIMDEGFQSIGDDFGYDVVLGVTKTNRSKIFQGGCISTLGDKAKVSSVNSGIHGPRGEGRTAELLEDKSHSIPVLLLHEGVHPIQPLGFGRSKGEHSSLDFLKNRYEIKERVIKRINKSQTRGLVCHLRGKKMWS